ncbi:MAG: prolyl oligopeptidase family serine peptidase [Phycisphaeraceae bacterium]
MKSICVLMSVVFVCSSFVIAQELKPIAPIPRLLPPKGVTIEKGDRDKLEARLAEVNKAIAAAKLSEDLLPDVAIYTKAVRWALDFDEFYDAKKDIAKAHATLDAAEAQLTEALSGKPPWVIRRGLVVRGYRSNIDDSVQPYGLHIPENLDLSKPVPLLVWLHGRGDKETDMHFIATRQKSKGEFAPDWCITLHPYGRGTIGFKFAGEIDVLDAIESVKKRYKIDEDRIALAGFSMGGAGAWHIGAHYADRFCVVHAGAGFVETAKYNRLKPEDYPADYVQKLWGWYDVPNYTRNLFNVPVIAYSGELDRQKQAADMMAAAFKAEGRELRHIIGPGVEHKYEAKAKAEVLKQINAAVDKGREKWPKEVHLQTRTLRYNRMHWVSIESMQTQWEEAHVDAKLVDEQTVELKTRNVSMFTLYPTDDLFFNGAKYIVNGQTIETAPTRNALGILSRRFQLVDGKWALMYNHPVGKSHGMSGTIDDAFMEPFIMITASTRSSDERFNRWVDFEFKHACERWRAVFRGDPRVVSEDKMDGSEFKRFNIVLWGEPGSHILLKIAMSNTEVPTGIGWSDGKVTVGDQTFDSRVNVPIYIARNPFRPTKYLVVNSGPTFREGHDRTNSQQNAKLPDWAIIGLDKDPDAFAPGEIKAAGFFDENWKVKK